MKLRSTRICKPRASLRRQSDSRQRISVPRRHSSRLAAKLRSVPTLHGLETNYKPQNLYEQLPTDPKISHPVGDVPYTHLHLPTSGPIEVSPPVSSRTQFQEYSYLPQTNNYQTQKRKSVDARVERPSKRTRLTEKNLKALEKMGRGKKSTGKRSTEQSTTTTTTDKDFGPQLQRNNVVFTSIDTREADDADEIRELLDQPRESEPPDELAYKNYLVATEGINNELTIQTAAYPLLSKRISCEAGISGYGQRANYAWSEVDNHLTTGLSDAKPDIFESYRKTDYPPEAVDLLSSALAPTAYNVAMPAFAVELKGSEGSMQVAHLQCAFDGAIMTEGARGVHTFMKKSDDDFYGKTQALTVAFNGELINYYGHHALPGPSQLAADGATPNEDTAGRAGDAVKYYPYLLKCDTPRPLFRNYRDAYKHIRNAQGIGYKWATERKDALWAYTNGDNTETPPDVPTSAQQPSNESLVSIAPGTPDDYNCHGCDDGVPIPAQQPIGSLVPVSSGPSDSHNCDASDDEVDPTDQLLREFRTNSTANDQGFSMQIAPTHDGYGPPHAPTYNPITPPLSSKDFSVPLESQQLSVLAVTESREDVDFNTRVNRKTRARTRHAAVERPREVVDNSKSRKSRKR